MLIHIQENIYALQRKRFVCVCVRGSESASPCMRTHVCLIWFPYSCSTTTLCVFVVDQQDMHLASTLSISDIFFSVYR